MKDAAELRHSLAHFTGSETIYSHALNRRTKYTEGVRHFAQNAGGGAYWLLDILATQPEILEGVKQYGFVIVVLKVTGTFGQLTVARDFSEEGERFEDVVYTQALHFTDCPEGLWKLYFIDGTILLPSEY